MNKTAPVNFHSCQAASKKYSFGKSLKVVDLWFFLVILLSCRPSPPPVSPTLRPTRVPTSFANPDSSYLVTGQVRDRNSLIPLVNKRVTITYNQDTYSGYTHVGGVFAIPVGIEHPQKFSVRISIVESGYKPYDETHTIVVSVPQVLDVRLVPLSTSTPNTIVAPGGVNPTLITPTRTPNNIVSTSTRIPPPTPTAEPSATQVIIPPTDVPIPPTELPTPVPPAPTNTNTPRPSRTPRPPKPTATDTEVPPTPSVGNNDFQWDTQYVCNAEPDVIENRVHNGSNVDVQVKGFIKARPDGGAEDTISEVPPAYQGCPAGAWCGPIVRIREPYPQGFEGVVWGTTNVYYQGKRVATKTFDPVRLSCP